MPSRYLNLDQLINLEQSVSEQAACRNILDSIDEGIFAVDRNMQIISFNRAAEQMTGHVREDVLGQFCYNVFQGKQCDQSCSVQKVVSSGETVFEHELSVHNKLNGLVQVAASAAPIFNELGEVVGAIETLRPLTSFSNHSKSYYKKNIFEGIYSRFSGMHGIFDVLPDIAASNATVLIKGDSGTGKELFACAVHNLSPRSSGPMVVINCGALPEPLLEAEIFGVHRGAYTGAVESRPGRLELAEGGTLFLDEIGDLPLALQVKLLRVLENHEYQPLGAKSLKHADVRFVAATHRSLVQMVEEGSFRRDLYFRLNVIGFSIPALKERREDIPLLIEMALDRFNREYEKKVRGFSADAMRVLMAHDFPGNVRELLNIVEQSIVFCHDDEIGLNLLPENLRQPDAKSSRKHARGCPERNELQEILSRFDGNRQRVASEYGVDRTTLWRWMQKRGFN